MDTVNAQVAFSSYICNRQIYSKSGRQVEVISHKDLQKFLVTH